MMLQISAQEVAHAGLQGWRLSTISATSALRELYLSDLALDVLYLSDVGFCELNVSVAVCMLNVSDITRNYFLQMAPHTCALYRLHRSSTSLYISRKSTVSWRDSTVLIFFDWNPMSVFSTWSKMCRIQITLSSSLVQTKSANQIVILWNQKVIVKWT